MAGLKQPKGPVTELGAQTMVSMTIVLTMLALGISLVVVGWLANQLAASMTGVGAIIGALSTGLNSPTGISAALAAIRRPPTAPDPTQTPAPDPQAAPTPETQP